jgi:HK97 family phage prohead protease
MIQERQKDTGMTDLTYKSATLEIKKEPDQDGEFEGYASVFGVVDGGNDVVNRGAFEKSLASRKPKMLWQHDPQQVIGVWDEVREDEKGLFVKGRILKDVERGREAMALMRAGAIDSMSIGYRTIKASNEGPSERVRRLMEVDLFEVSVVTFPMLSAATITDVKSMTTEREFERFLRDAGYSRKEATAITLHGFKGLTDQRDAVARDVDMSGAHALLDQLKQLQKDFSNG